MKTSLRHSVALFALFSTALLVPATAQVNSGSDGSDGAFNPTSNVTINMADHPTGIYQYTSVNIPAGVTVTFIPNANNTPVVWLVQTTCVIAGTVDLSGKSNGDAGGAGGPGGFRGGDGGNSVSTNGEGPGGGVAGNPAAHASFGTVGDTNVSAGQPPAGPTYGSNFLLPLIGGSGGGGASYPTSIFNRGGRGGGGAILIAASSSITISGTLSSRGASGSQSQSSKAGSGSGGSIRLVTTSLNGSGTITAQGGQSAYNLGNYAGDGRVRLDCFSNQFTGTITGVMTQGFQPVILPAAGQGIELTIASIGGTSVPASPAGVLTNPDVIIAAQQANPIAVVVSCSNIPLGTPITITVHPANGADVTATGTNNTGTQAASTATIAVNMPRGGGIIYATATTGITGSASTGSGQNPKVPSIARTGWTAGGEKFVAMEVTAGLGGKQRIVYLTESRKRYPFPGN